MKEEKRELLIGEFLSPENSADKREELRSELIRSGYNPAELQEMETLYSKLDEMPVPESGKKLDDQFYRSIEVYKDAHGINTSFFTVLVSAIRRSFAKKYILRFTYSLILIAFGWLLGNWSGQNGSNGTKIKSIAMELDQMKKVMMVTMLEQPSAAQRIKAISFAENFENVDERILNAFLNTLNRDPNPNVRLSAVEALSRYADNQFVRDGLVRSISVQDSPLVQVALIDLMLKLKEKASITEFNKLLEKKELNYSVRDKTRETIRLL